MKKRALFIGLIIGTMCLASACSNTGKQTQESQTAMATENSESNVETETAANNDETIVDSETTIDSEQQESKRVIMNDTLAEQAKVDEQLMAEVSSGYTIDEPFIVVNPYGNSPLTAVAIFNTDESTGVKLLVKGEKTEDNIEASFGKETTHIIPIYGLYSGKENEVTFTLDDGTTKTVQVTTEALETTIGNQAEIKTIDNNEYDFSKLTFASGGAANEIAAYDSAGAIRWYCKTSGLPFKQLSNGHFLAQTDTLIHPLYYMSGIIEFDLTGKIYNEYSIPGGSHHAAFEMPNGNLLIGSCTTDFSNVEDRIVEIDRTTGEVVWELNLEELLDVTDGSSLNQTEKDWFHNNAVWYDEKTDTILISGRHVDAVIGVNKENKTLSWVMGNPEGWTTVDEKYFFKPIGDNFEWQYAQHNITMLPNGDVMVFDNGDSRTKKTQPDNAVAGDQVYSRAVVYHLDYDNMTIEQVWEYGKERGPEWYSSFISGADYIGDNNYWITSGGNMFDAKKNTYDVSPYDQLSPDVKKQAYIDQVKDNKLVFEMVVPSLVYRSIRADMYAEESSYLDLTVKGQWLGDLGVTETVDQKVDCGNAAAGEESWVLDQKPFGLMFSGTLPSNSEDVKPGYIILEDEEGNQNVYTLGIIPMQQKDDSKILNMSATISSKDLAGKMYHIYIEADGTVYDTGYEIKF
ncbi:aryl-sulfate sulfotransferase [Robinsoniella peoriensis]|uniref:aryl-sulfate sulfotransferase n=1 Tax=Robinsoniella peoriensis TaxID=180332 RepID=UPI00085C00C8|nr:aryl-sulfate sulfotransferase [Robinsoniella peoriensis]